MFQPGCKAKVLGLDMFRRSYLKFSSDLVSLNTSKCMKPVLAIMSYYSSTNEFLEHPGVHPALLHYQ